MYLKSEVHSVQAGGDTVKASKQYREIEVQRSIIQIYAQTGYTRMGDPGGRPAGEPGTGGGDQVAWQTWFWNEGRPRLRPGRPPVQSQNYLL